MITKEEFLQKCNDLIPKEEIDKYNKAQKKMWTTLIITLLIETLILIGIFSFWKPIIYIAPVVYIISISIIVVNLRYQWGDLKNKYSKPVLDILFNDYKYSFQPASYINQQVFKSSCFNKDFDHYSGEDLLNVNIPNDDGTPSNVKFSVCDLRVTKEETYTVTRKDSNGRWVTTTETRTVVVYSGAFGCVYFPFKFKCDLSINVNSESLKRIKLEDETFNKRCKVYTDNQLEALVILTPTLMNKLKAFTARISKFKINISKDGRMYFGMSRNMFELSKRGKKPTGQVFERYYNDVVDMLAMIDEIKNNNKVFKM